MSYLNGRKKDLLSVPVICGSNHGTAFFVSSTKLLTARHVVRDAFVESTIIPVSINVAGKTIVCRAQEQSENITIRKDVALLTIDDEENSYESADYFDILSDDFIPDLRLLIVGYPRELALSVRQISISVQNRLEIDDYNDRSVVVLDTLRLMSYEGLSGSPVINRKGNVIGIVTMQEGSNLSYCSVKSLKDILVDFGLVYREDWQAEDDTILGLGRSHDLCWQAISTVLGSRYMPDLHQENEKLEAFLTKIVDSKNAEKHKKNIDELISLILNLKNQNKTILCRKGTDINLLNRQYFENDEYNELKYATNILRERRSFFDLFSEEGFRISELLQEIDNDSYESVRLSSTKFVCIIGKAGSGKTHSLCHFAEYKSLYTNVYLFFSTEFQSHISATHLIENRICENGKLEDFNNQLQEIGRSAVVVIDALNEGVGCHYWNQQLGGLRERFRTLSNMKLIVSVRSPFENDINDLNNSNDDNDKWVRKEIEGFEDKEKAIQMFFKTFNIPQSFKLESIDEFTNPLFLKAFCEVFHTLDANEKRRISKRLLYKKYVDKRNASISSFVEEDPEIKIADKYLNKLANYSVFYNDFNVVSRQKARRIARNLCPYRTWKNDLLNACLSENLLLDDKSHDNEPAIMYEYENLGDYYKAEQLMSSKMTTQKQLEWLCEELKSLKRRDLYPNSNFDNAVIAYFDNLMRADFKISDYHQVRTGGMLHGLFYDYLIASHLKQDNFIRVVRELDTDGNSPLSVVEDFDKMSLDNILAIHSKLMNYETVGKRDVIWTQYVNELYRMYGDDFVGEQPIEYDPTIPLTDDEKKYIVILVWMLTSSHPKFRAIISRKIYIILKVRTELIVWVVNLFLEVNDPYIQEGLFRAICGIVLISNNQELVVEIASIVFKKYYKSSDRVPLDLLVRQWTLKILERASFLNSECTYWEEATTTSNSEMPAGHQKLDEIPESYFGLQMGSKRIQHSICGFEDFNRYIIGENTRSRSSDFFIESEDNFKGYRLDDIEKDLAYEIMHTFGWNDRLGRMDNNVYSLNRSHNDTERMGKKYQWLAWYRVNAILMDNCKVTKERYFYGDKAKSEDFTVKAYPWVSSASSYFDPTLDVKKYKQAKVVLSGTEQLSVNGAELESWIDDDSILPQFRYTALDDEGTEYVMLMCYDTCKTEPKETFIFANAGFVKECDSNKFKDWARNENFYGRWMPERRGMIEFLWSDYPWADAYRSILEYDPWEEPTNNCPCRMMLSYESQLQEDWEGIGNEDEYLTTVYMPCMEMMEQLNLYCSEVRGIVRSRSDDSLAAVSIEVLYGVHGLFVRKDLLNKYLKDNRYSMFYYVLGEKVLHEAPHSYMRDLSGAFEYNIDGSLSEIQPLRVIKRAPPKSTDNKEIIDVIEGLEGLTPKEMSEQMELKDKTIIDL